MVLYGAIGGREWQGNDLRPTPIEELIAQVNLPGVGYFRRSRSYYFRRRRGALPQLSREIKKNCHIRIYRDAPHGWLNDTMPGRYRKEAAKDAWKLMMSFLKNVLPAVGIRIAFPAHTKATTRATYDFKKNVRME